jgi:AraC family transcriptional regulator
MESPRIVEITPKKLTGMHIETSLSENKTRILWSNFMPKLKKVAKNTTQKLYSIQVFDKDLNIDSFNPKTIFTKWAAAEISDVRNTPECMESFILPGDLYAVFIHKGPAHTFPGTSQYIFGHWLPNSKYELDHRPHFEIMDENYPGSNDPDSEEEVWIPIRKKSEA